MGRCTENFYNNDESIAMHTCDNLSDPVTRPSHYVIADDDGSPLCEVRDIQNHLTRHMRGLYACDMANAAKYLLRSPFKGKLLQDLKKARFMINAMIERLEDDR